MLNILSLDPLGLPNEGKIVQLLDSSMMIFGGPPICTDSKMTGITITTPISGHVWSLGSGATIDVLAPQSISLKIIPNNTTDIIIALTSCISIVQLN